MENKKIEEGLFLEENQMSLFENTGEKKKKQSKKIFSLFQLQLVKEKNFSYSGEPSIDSPESTYDILENNFHLSIQAEEIVVILCLDTKGKVTGAFEVSRGSLTSCIVHPREVFKRIILCNSNKFIIAHNHPSGNPDPSEEDVDITRRLTEAGNLLGIELLDHIIIGDGEGDSKFVSLRRLGII